MRDLDGDGYAESIRGSSRAIGEEDTLYMELNILTNGHLEDGIITINNNNFYFLAKIPKNNEIKENAMGSNIKKIELNNIKNGTQKLLQGEVRSGDYQYTSEKAAAIGNNTNNYSRENAVTLTGTHVAEDGTRTPISKTVKFKVDWHGKIENEIIYTNNIGEIDKAINEEKNELNLSFKVKTQETANELIIKRTVVEGIIPELNGYAPIRVESKSSNVTWEYNEETKEFKVIRQAQIDENSKVVTQTIARENEFEIQVTYPLEAYQNMGTESVQIQVPISSYYEGYNNENKEFENPIKSNVAKRTIIINYGKPTGYVARFDVTVGKYVYAQNYKYIVSKKKPLSLYNQMQTEQSDDTYIVNWYGYTGSQGETGGMIMKETPTGEKQEKDQFIKKDGRMESMEELTENIGIYFASPEDLLGREGWIKVYDDETNELIQTFTIENWNKYNSDKPYLYEIPIKHIRIETSSTNKEKSISINHIKRLNDEAITQKYTREEFDNLQYINSNLVGYIGGTYINEINHSAIYEAPYTTASMNTNKEAISTQETEKDMQITIRADGNENSNQEKWLNGSFLLKLPQGIIDLEINNVTISNSKVKIVSYEQITEEGIRYIKINTQNDTEETFYIYINCQITPDPRMATETQAFDLYYYNENGTDYVSKTQDSLDINDNLNTQEMIGKTSINLNLVSPTSLLTSQTITDYDDKESIAVSPQIAEVRKEQRTANINVEIRNNYSNTVSDIVILGRIPFENNKYVINQNPLNSNFTANMQNTGIIVPAELQEKAEVYYSENENATKDLEDANNGWTKKPQDFSKIKSYLISLGEYTLGLKESHKFTYTVQVPEGLNYNQISYGHHAVYFTLDTDQGKYRTQTEPNAVGLRIAKQYNLEISKYQKGKEKLVSGATYHIVEEGETEGKTQATKEGGKLTLKNLYVDKTYVIKEIKSPQDYELNTEEIKFRAIEENGNLQVQLISGTVKNIQAVQPESGSNYKIVVEVEDEAKAKLKITKVEQGTSNAINLVSYKITGKNLPEGGKIVITNKKGEINLSGLSIGEQYTLEERKAEGYYLASPIKFTLANQDGNYEVNIQEGTVKTSEITEEDSLPTINLTIENEKIPRYNLQIKKVAKGEETPLAGAKFRLLKGKQKIEDYTTDDQGMITISDLYQYETSKNLDQTYTLKEIVAPEGYSALKDITFYVENKEGILTMQVKEGKIKEQIANEDTITITLEDSPAFKLIKKDGETGEILPNTKFAIYNVDNGGETLALDAKFNILGTKEIINGKEYYVLTTNEKGEIEANLREGLYKAVEVKASDDKYDITNNEYYFGIGASREEKENYIVTQAITVGGPSREHISCVSETSDGGYLVGGYSAGLIQDNKGKPIFQSVGGQDGMVIKYTQEGEVEWTISVGGIKDDYIFCAKETSDRGYIVGGQFNSPAIKVEDYTLTSNSGSTAMLIKYTKERKVEWATTLKSNMIGSIEETRDGGYLVGGGEYGYDKIIKYDSEGKKEWEIRDELRAVRKVSETSDGGYIVAGEFIGTSKVGGYTFTSKGGDDGIVIKYDSERKVEWAFVLGGTGSDIMSEIAETRDGGYIATGYFQSPSIQVGEYTLTNKGSNDGMIIKFTSKGEVEWATSVGESKDDYVFSVVETDDGEYMVGGRFESSTLQVGDYTLNARGISTTFLIKYTQKGEAKWATTIVGESVYGGRISKTSTGGIIISGSFSGYIQAGDTQYYSKGNRDGYVIRFENLEDIRTTQAIGIGGSGYETINSVIATSDGGSIVGGQFDSPVLQVGNDTITSKGSFDGMLVKYTKVGEVEWATSIGGSDFDDITSVAETSDGGYIATGYFTSQSIQVGDYILTSQGQYNGMLIKYNSKGKVEWATSVGGSGYTYIKSVATTRDGDIVVGGYFYSSSIQVGEYMLTNKGSSAGMIIEYNNEGEVEWAASIDGSNYDYIEAVSATRDGGIIVGGWFRGTIQLGDNTLISQSGNSGMVIKYTKEGEVEWATSVGAHIQSISETSDRGYILGGSFDGTLQVGNHTLTSKGDIAGMVIKYTKEGEAQWATSVESSELNEICEVLETTDGGYIAGGSFDGTLQVGNHTLTSKGDTTGMVIKYNSKGEVEWVTSVGIGGNSICSIAEALDGGVLIGGAFNSSEMETDTKTLINQGYSDGMLLKLVHYKTVPEVQELIAKNVRKEFKITTEVNKIEDVKGGSISGEGKISYETVRYGDSNTKEIRMVPEENYEIIGVTVNGKEYPFTSNEDRTYIMPQFDNIQEDKHIVVTYALRDNKIIVNKIDSKTREPLQGVKFKLDQLEERTKPENVIENLTNNSNTFYEADTTEEITDVLGELTNNGTYYFEKQEDGTYIPTNGKTYQLANGGTAGVQSVTANSYIPIDLSSKEGKYFVVVNANVSSRASYDYGYATINQTTTAPAYSNSTGRFMYISGTAESVINPKDYTSLVLDGGKTYYLHLGYRKSTNTDIGDDQLVINSIKVYGATEVTYNFREENGKYISSNQGKANTTANSYIPIDLSSYTGKYNLSVKAKVSSQSSNDYGYVTVTNSQTAPAYNSSTGRLVYISGTKEDTYTTVLQGGTKYYMHLGYYKNASTDTGEDTFTVSDIKVSLNDSELYHTQVETNSQGQAITQIPFGRYSITEVEEKEGYQPLEKPVIVDFKPDNRAVVENENVAQVTVNEAGEYVIENIEKAKVIVHHYLKDNAGNYTTIKVAEDEIKEGKVNETYTTAPHLDLKEYELEKRIKQEAGGTEGAEESEITSKEVEYVIPENATGTFKEEVVEVTYYYETKDIPLVVHHYIEGTETKVLLANGEEAKDIEGKAGKQGESYETSSLSSEELNAKYELVEVPENATGTYEYDKVEVTYYYKVKASPGVIVHHIDEQTKEKIAEDVQLPETSDAKYGDSYTTSQLENLPENYEFVRRTENWEGTMIDELIEVTYEYRRKEPIIQEQTIEKTGTKSITSKEEEVIYEISYTAKIDEYIGKVQVIVVDTVPYEIEEEKSNLAGGEYNAENKTITWKEVVEVNTYANDGNNANSEASENTGNSIDISKKIKIVFRNIDTNQKSMENKVSGKIKFYTPEKETEEVTSKTITELNFKRELKVVKEWQDNENEAQRRPNEIKVVVKEGENIVAEQILNTSNAKEEDSNIWEYTFENLEKYNQDGSLKDYVVEEQEVKEGDLKFYTNVIEQEGVAKEETTEEGEAKEETTEEAATTEDIAREEQPSGEAKIVNTFTVPEEKVSLVVKKKWNHTNNIYEKPERIKLQVKNGQEVIQEQIVTKANKVEDVELGEEINRENEEVWSHEFTNLAKYDNLGNEIEYTVEEQEVEEGELRNYKKEIDNERKTITNSYIGPIITQEKQVSTENNLSYVVEGEKVTYKIIVENAGEIAKDVVVKDIVPEGLKMVEGSIKVNGSSNYVLGEETIDLSAKTAEDLKNGITVNVPAKAQDSSAQETGRIAESLEETEESTQGTQPEATTPGQEETTNGKVEISFEATVEELEEGSYQQEIKNKATVDEKETNETSITVNKSKITFEKTVSPEGEVKAGDELTYSIKIRNTGTAPKTVRVKDSVPEKTTFVEGSIKINTEQINDMTREKEYTEEELSQGIEVRVEPNEETSISFKVKVNTKVEDGEIIKNKAIVNKTPESPDTPENEEETNETSNPVIASVLSIEKEQKVESGNNYVVKGDIIEYKILVTNSGKLGQEVVIRDQVPEGTSFVEGSIRIDGETMQEVNGEQNNVGNKTEEELAEGIRAYVKEQKDNVPSRMILSFKVKVNDNAVGDIKNKAVVSKIPESPDVSGEETNETSIPVITFEKQSEINRTTQEEQELEEGAVTANDEIIYKVRISNSGREQVNNIEVKDTVPEGTKIKQVKDNGEVKGEKEITWVIDSLLAGETKEVSFIVIVEYAQEDRQIKNTAYVGEKASNETVDEYKKPEISLNTSIEKTGDNIISKTDSNIYYELRYTATIENYVGKAKIKIVDNLPYEIEEEKSELAGGTYNAEEKTITWEETVEDINTYKTLESKVINRVKILSLSYKYVDEENLAGEIKNTVKVKTDLVEPKEASQEDPSTEKIVKTQENEADHVVVAKIPTKVIVHHYIYDKEKKEYTTVKIAQDEEINGIVGNAYTTKKSDKVPANYSCLNETPEKQKGTMTKTPIEVNYYYQLRDETITGEITKVGRVIDNKGNEVITKIPSQETAEGLETTEGTKTTEIGATTNNNDNNSQETVKLIDSNKVLTKEDQLVEYTIQYKTAIKEYEGKAKIVLVDKLPAKIDIDKSDIAGGKYNEEENTITWETVVDNISAIQDREFSTTVVKVVRLSYIEQNKANDLINIAEGRTITYYPETHSNKPGEEKQTIKQEIEETIKQQYVTEKTVEKIWKDHNNEKQKRPASVEMWLTANGRTSINNQELEKVILSEENNWEYTFRNLVKYDALGNEIRYSVEEREVTPGDLAYYENAQITTNENITVTNEYKLMNTNIESSITKEGNEKIETRQEEVKYHIHYQAVVKDYIGDAVVNIIDTLPYKIDIEKSELQKGKYNENTKTITWEEKVDNIDTVANGNYIVNIEKEIKVVYTDIDAKMPSFLNHVKGKIEFTQNETKNEVEAQKETQIDIKGKVVVKYIEKETGEEIEKEEIIENKVGEIYETEAKQIKNYEYIESQGETKGNIKEGTKEVIYYYSKIKSGTVKVKYVDEEGNEIAEPEEIEGRVGEKYETKEKQIENYELEKVTGDSREGTLEEKEKEVIYHYKKIATKVIVKYLEKETEKELAKEETIEGKVGENYEAQRKVIEGYQKAEPEPENARGKMEKETIYVTYYYEKIQGGKIIVKYVDLETKQEILYIDENNERKTYGYEMKGYLGENYETQEKEIKYYKYQKQLEPSNREGKYELDEKTIVYYYKKQAFNISVEKSIKQASINGELADIKKDEKIMKMEIVASKAKKVDVEVRYKIVVSNTGEIEGKATLKERLPEGFKVSESNPKYWKEEKDGNLTTTVELKAKESKELEVILNWKNGASNFGGRTNTVEIVNTQNPANYLETTKEDNISEATVVMSVKTGTEKKVLTVAIGTIAISGLLILLYQYQCYQIERNREIRHVVVEGKNVVIKKKKQK